MKETLNLLPVEVKAGLPKMGKFYYLFLGLSAYIVLMTGLWSYKFIAVKRLDAETNKLNKQKMELQQKILPPSPVVVVPSVEKGISEAVEKAPQWSLIISDLSIIVPENIWLSSIESKEDKGIRQMNIKGFSKTQLEVANLISSLESSRHFYDVQIVFAQKGEKDVTFELKARLKWT
ncbi:MAG: PilN domain-containing protein [Nitrospirae bacterium]|nr:PilN domain-containing protein [Nitrospirota bacterium]